MKDYYTIFVWLEIGGQGILLLLDEMAFDCQPTQIKLLKIMSQYEIGTY